MVLSIVGDVSWKKDVEHHFTFTKKPRLVRVEFQEPADTTITTKKVKKNIANTYLVLGFKTVPKNNNDAYALEIINTMMGRGQSSVMFTEIRSKLGLAYDVGSQHVAEVTYGYFSLYACVDKKNMEKTKKLMLTELKNIQNVSELDLEEAKTAIEGEFCLDIDEPQKRADQLLFWEHARDARDLSSFISNIKKVTRQDIRRVINKYFKDNYTYIILEGK